MTETVLFVGGSADGKMMAIAHPMSRIDFQIMQGVAVWTDCPERIPVTTETYNRVAPHCYLISTESPDNLIPLLIEGYRRKE